MSRSTIATIPIPRSVLGRWGRPQGRASCKDAVKGPLPSFPADPHMCTPGTDTGDGSAVPLTWYTGLHVTCSGEARQIQAVKGTPWVMLTPLPVTVSEALPPPAVRKKPPVFWRPVGFPKAGPSHDYNRASSEEDNDKAARADNFA